MLATGYRSIRLIERGQEEEACWHIIVTRHELIEHLDLWILFVKKSPLVKTGRKKPTGEERSGGKISTLLEVHTKF